MTLAEEIAHAQTYIANPPANESETCEQVILPLLWTVYDRREVQSRQRDNSGHFPDYTLLPNTKHRWYLEAKSWTETLIDKHVYQASSYANINGSQWFVLTNGRQWRLYDNHLSN